MPRGRPKKLLSLRKRLILNKHLFEVLVLCLQYAEAKRKQEEELERLQQITTTPPSFHVTENQHGDEGEEAELEGTTDFSLEGIANVGSEMERVHITEKNKSMAAKLKVIIILMIV